MSTTLSVRIPAGKLGTVRVDRTVDIYPTSLINDENISYAKSYIPKLKSQRQLTATSTPLIITNPQDECSYIPIIKSNNQSDPNDEDISDIAVIYSLVRRSSIRRTSSPRLSVLPLSVNFNISRPYIAKTYTLEPPLTPTVSHVSKQAQIKTLSSKLSTSNFLSISTSSSTEVSSSTRIQTSTSFTRSDRPLAPSVSIKPRPYSFRNTGRSALERQISNITERVAQLQETFFSRRSNTSNHQRNRSLSNFQSTIISTNIHEYNRSHIRLIRPRPKSETYDNHRRINSAGSYAQLTLLGQPKVNSISQTQKTIPVDYQNGRVQYRTQTSNPERPHSTISSNSLQTVFDTKRTRDSYEKLLKQLEISRKELDRQRSKGLNHHPARILQLESQIKQYEQQLNKFKPYLDSIDVFTDPSSNIYDDNVITRPQTFIESSTNRLSTQSHGNSGHKKQNSLPESAVLQVMTGISPSTSVSSPLHHIKRKFHGGKTDAYDLVKNWDSLNSIPTDETFKLRESYEIDDDNSYTLSSNVQSISSFDDIQQSINTSNWIPLTIFLNFLLNDTNSDPSHLLFYIITEDLHPTDGNSSFAEQNKVATVGRCSSDRRAASDRPTAPKNRSSSNPQMGGNTIDEILSHRIDSDVINQQDATSARSFYVIDTDKKQLIEVEANSKDDLEKWLEWIEKARQPFEKAKSFPYSSKEKSLHSSSSTLTIQSTISEEQPNIQTIESNEKDTPESIFNSIMTTDTEIKRLLHEKQMLLSRLLNIPQDTSSFSLHTMKPNTSLEAVTYATSYHNQLMQIINQIPNEIDKTIDIQSISTPLIKLGEQLTLTLKLLSQDSKKTDNENLVYRRNSSSFNATPSMNTDSSQTYSDLSISSLHSSKSLGSVVNSYQQQQPQQQQSSITDLDEAVKSTPLKELQVARDIVERYDEGVFDDGAGSQTEEDENNSVVIADSDDEDEIEHFDSTDCIMTNIDNNQQQVNNDYLVCSENNQNDRKNSNNTSREGKTINFGNG
ncbi:unnamed protein product [Rotaria sp. Silwood1]|nr:unnamed protein product [Rotaria sp. Silwood1]